VEGHDFDWVVIGSGFGGSVSALRLAEKGYRVAVIEVGRRFEDKDFAKSTWNMRSYFWMPRIGLRGILRMSPFKDVFVVSGSGVGGGSLGYANTLYRPRPAFYRDGQWGERADREVELGPHYMTAERMLGVTLYRDEGPADRLLHEYAAETGANDTYANTQVGIYFGEPGETVEDPYFGGEGPARTGCNKCGSCMVGCRHGAKNTLVKNYLYFAEKLGVEVRPGTEVTDIKPLGAEDGSDGYRLSLQRSGAVLSRHRRSELTARGVIVSAGALGTNRLLANCRHSGSLPRLSDRVGYVVRTNSESIQAVTAPDDSTDFSKSVAITSSIYPDPDTHIEVVTYGKAGGVMNRLYTMMTGEGTRLTRPVKWVAAMARHPIQTAKLVFFPRHWSQRTVILLVMQSTDSAMRLKPKRRWFRRGVNLQTEQDPLRPNPTFIQAAEDVTKWFAERIGGIPQSSITESTLNIPTTAHILGGAVVGESPESGVIDADRVFGYENLMVCDGSAVPANPGVNPSLTITAMSERAMSKVPLAEGADGLLHLPDEARAARTRDTVDLVEVAAGDLADPSPAPPLG
jgi:cholesterol oxidase